jgi:hypothetical protein
MTISAGGSGYLALVDEQPVERTRSMSLYERETTLKSMRSAQRRGIDPYNSADSQAKAYECIWRLNNYR